VDISNTVGRDCEAGGMDGRPDPAGRVLAGKSFRLKVCSAKILKAKVHQIARDKRNLIFIDLLCHFPHDRATVQFFTPDSMKRAVRRDF